MSQSVRRIDGWDAQAAAMDDQQIDATIAAYAAPDSRLQLAQQASKPTLEQKLEQQLLHAIDMEKRAATRVKRASTLLLKWQRARRRIERRIGESQVRTVISRLQLGASNAQGK